ncbi:MAG: hypothetical protein R2827_12815 [Bdellovibrionales bacterium]
MMFIGTGLNKSTVLHIAIALSFILTAELSFAGVHYKCSTEFGEQVLLQVGKKRFNEAAKAEKQRSKVKSWPIDSKDAFEYKTRYLRQPGPNFEFKISCDEKREEQSCQASFDDNKKSLTLKAPPLFDKRDGATGEVKLQWTTREVLGILIRVFKKDDTGAITSSSSGESKFYSEPNSKRISFDVGADEQVLKDKKWVGRIATLEFKIECQKVPGT